MCRRRIKGLLNVGLVLWLDIVIMYHFFGVNITCIATLVFVVYVFFVGEWLDIRLLKSGIPLEDLQGMEEFKLRNCSERVIKQAREKYNLNNFSPQFYMLPNNIDINAYAFGHKYIGVNQAALQMDQGLIEAILAHEVGHTLALDATLNRILFMNLIVFSSIFLIGKYIFLMCIIGIFALLAFFGVFRSWISVYFFSGLLKVIKAIAEGMGHIFLIFYHALNCLRNRGREYAADKFACELGYGTQLAYFLRRFAENPRYARTLAEALYDTHPLPQKRVKRIEEFEQKKMIAIKEGKVRN